MALEDIIVATADTLAPLKASGAARAVLPDPPERIVHYPTVYVEARGGVCRLPGGSYEGDLSAWDHEYVVVGTVGQGYEPRFHRLAVRTFDAIRAVLDADPTLGGNVTAAGAAGYVIQMVSVGNTDHTAVIVTVRAEEK